MKYKFNHLFSAVAHLDGFLQYIQNNWKTNLALTLSYYYLEEEDQQKIKERVENFYFDNMPIDTNAIQNLTNVYI